MQQLEKPFRDKDSSDRVLRAKDVFSSVFGWYFALHPDPGRQNVADPTDPDPKHWF